MIPAARRPEGPAAGGATCRECKGTGRIGYFYAQDCCRIVPCWKCFPEDRAAQRERDDWNRHSRDYEASLW